MYVWLFYIIDKMYRYFYKISSYISLVVSICRKTLGSFVRRKTIEQVSGTRVWPRGIAVHFRVVFNFGKVHRCTSM